MRLVLGMRQGPGNEVVLGMSLVLGMRQGPGNEVVLGMKQGPGNEPGSGNEAGAWWMRQGPGYEAGPWGMRLVLEMRLPFGHTSQLKSFYHCVS